MGTTITINVDEKVAREFRHIAAAVYGNGKGHLGKAVQEALDYWVGVHRKKSSETKLFEIMDRGYKLGGIAYAHRGELHERK